MIRQTTILFALCSVLLVPSAYAEEDKNSRKSRVTKGAELPPYLQCVPYARQQSGVKIFGDAHTWWGQAKGRYTRGNAPKVGAVMAFAPHRNMRLGHVAAISKIIDSRTVLLDHANWSPINGRRGQVERNVKAIDVSANNDWSQVRVWYHPIQALGKTVWPVRGFIYSKGAPKNARKSNPKRVANGGRGNIAGSGQGHVSPPEQWVKRTVTVPARKKTSPAFTKAFGSVEGSAKTSSAQRQAAPQRNAPSPKASPYKARKVTPYTPRNAVPKAVPKAVSKTPVSARSKSVPVRKVTPYTPRRAAPAPQNRQQIRVQPKKRVDPLDAVLSRYEK